MSNASHISPDLIRSRFSAEMSAMYRDEVPAYGTLMQLVARVNEDVLAANPGERARLEAVDDLARISEERHGAIRVGTAQELYTIRRLFAVMGMMPVGYYDLSEAGVPVHATAFRPVGDAALKVNPFRVFTSLLRLDLIKDKVLREQAAEILAARQIFTPGCLELIEKAENEGGLSDADANRFVAESLETFRWQPRANVSVEMYQRLHDAHRLVADVVSFKGPHINHLTPRTLDIDEVQRLMPEYGITPKAVVEGPPTRKCPVLLRQTSFKAMEEPVEYLSNGEWVQGSHTARFGEIEQRGVALTPKGRGLYDRLLTETRKIARPAADGWNAVAYMSALATTFARFPDDWATLRAERLAYFSYSLTDRANTAKGPVSGGAEEQIAAGLIRYDPIVYEDFLPVSAAGIFQSNLGDGAAQEFVASPNQQRFEADLGATVLNEFEHYEAIQANSLQACLDALAKRQAV